MIDAILFMVFVVLLLGLIYLGYKQRMKEQDTKINESIDNLNKAIDEYNKRKH